jgi:RING finger protein 113A
LQKKERFSSFTFFKTFPAASSWQKKKRKKMAEPGKPAEEDEEEKEEVVAVTFKKKSRANVRKRKGTKGDDENDELAKKVNSSNVNADDDNRERERREEERNNNGKQYQSLLGGSSKASSSKIHEKRVFAYEGDRSVQIRDDGGATREIEIDTARDRDGRALREQKLKLAAERLKQNNENNKDVMCGAVVEDDKVYRGTNAYTDYRAGFRKEQTIANEKGGGAHGPARASANVRTTYVMDYKPDICKDYKDTGYCGYGDACKFVHDRGDYKQGWQLDKDWERKLQEQKEKQAALEKMEKALNSDGEEVDLNPDDDEEDDETFDGDIPGECQMCSESWMDVRNPVVTKCKHYFCEACALRNDSAKKEKTCFTCEMPTGGTFNSAKDILKRVKDMKRDGVKTWGKKKKEKKQGMMGGGASQQKNVDRSSGWALG